ncbi:adhesion G protein-coupled receptor F5-like [Pelobates fuscus]|uniref:adhesion G protein-coupled receptor F5-like n=1 Tax=Pelobates fuscus TaxID=191477 RepID=UPI002FE430D8
MIRLSRKQCLLICFFLLEIPKTGMASDQQGNITNETTSDKTGLLSIRTGGEQNNEAQYYSRRRRAAGDTEYAAVIEISFDDPNMGTQLKAILEDTEVYQSLVASSITITKSSITSVVGGISQFPTPIYAGDTLTINCQFIGLSNDIFWTFKSQRLSNDSRHTIMNNVQESILKITNVASTDAGNYTCNVNTQSLPQVQSTVVDVKNLNIATTGNLDAVCDGTKYNLTCCISDSGTFNVTWSFTGKIPVYGSATYNSPCNIYTIQASISQCPLDLSGNVTRYICEYKGLGNGTIGTGTIDVTYIRKANVYISSVSAVSVGKPLKINCQIDVYNYNKIQWARNTIDNVLAKGLNQPYLSTDIANKEWAGTYFCIVYQNSISSSANTSVRIVDLPTKNAIEVDPILVSVMCNDKQKMNCCFNKGGDVSVNFKGSDNTVNPGSLDQTVGNQACYTTTLTVECNAVKQLNVECNITNELGDSVTSEAMTINTWIKSAESLSCNQLEGVPESPNGANYSESCQKFNKSGTVDYTCTNGNWSKTDNCYSTLIHNQLLAIESLKNDPQPSVTLPIFLQNLSNVSINNKNEISTSTQSINVMLTIISTVSNISITVQPAMMENFVSTVNVLVDNTTAWRNIKEKGPDILKSVELFAERLQDGDFSTNESNSNIQLKAKTLNSSLGYMEPFELNNLTSTVTIRNDSLPNKKITIVSIAYSTMKDILPPAENKSLSELVISTVIGEAIDFTNFTITMTFPNQNQSLISPQCVYWDFNLTQSGGWNDKNCTPKEENGTVTCNCNHLTSFSILFSPSPNNPNNGSAVNNNNNNTNNNDLEIITYVGVGISIASLVIALLIEFIVWRSVIKNKTSYMRHVCLVNIAVTLLAADIWFMIGAGLEKDPNTNACLVAAFFSFYFYLALFFWMLAMGLLLFHRMIFTLQELSRSTMLITAFILGYVCPLIIAVITVGSTIQNQQFTSGTYCWLDYNRSMSFLAFVVPSLTIVFINCVILLVVISKLLRPSVGERSRTDDRLILIQITKSIAVLTPLLGITWGFGLGLVIETNKTNKVLHGIFAGLNSFQGLFILISTVLLDQKVRLALRNTISSSYSSTFRARVQASSTNSSVPSSGLPKRKKLFPKRGAYNVFHAQSSSNETSTNSYSVLS